GFPREQVPAGTLLAPGPVEGVEDAAAAFLYQDYVAVASCELGDEDEPHAASRGFHRLAGDVQDAIEAHLRDIQDPGRFQVLAQEHAEGRRVEIGRAHV